MRTLFRTLLSLCMLLAFANASPAQTPDGSTPAEETVCDGETGAAYGLCNAFCEAMDCETDDPQASAIACGKVKGKYQQITGHEPPCLAQPLSCPCIELMPDFLEAANAPVSACIDASSTEGSSFVLLSAGVPVAVAVPGLGGSCGLLAGTQIEITEAEGLACIDFLRAKAAAAGVTCSSGVEE